jgi:hypothetical protein
MLAVFGAALGAGADGNDDVNGWMYATGHSPESCGRRIVRQALALRRSGVSPGYVFRLPSGCPRIILPPGYAGRESAAGVEIYDTGTGKAIVTLAPPERNAAERVLAERDGVYDGEVWEKGQFKGRVVVHDDGRNDDGQ